MKAQPRQLALALPHPESLARDDFLGGASNTDALRLIEAWPDWPDRMLLLIGPEGSGKSHLLRLLAGLAVRHEGELVLGARVNVGYFSQNHDIPGLRGRTVIDACRDVGLDRGAAMGALRR